MEAASPGMVAPGSSPRSRGTQRMGDIEKRRGRFIPALAGNTPAPPWTSWSSPVHPRARGEHLARSARRSASIGSSPRSRGTLPPYEEEKMINRFIPALAGNTMSETARSISRSVHPRARGEHREAQRVQGLSEGSSPRSRGTPATPGAPGADGRFIPALAGNTRGAARAAGVRPVHPRARGEHDFATSEKKSADGSSPRSRGTRASAPPCPAAWGFIPALAGNTRKGRRWSFWLSVHPRARGEHMVSEQFRICLGGSSPRSRGTHPRFRGWVARRRFIPALAGNTAASAAFHAPHTVHPRARGEHAPVFAPRSLRNGSSPRSRGTRDHGRAD